MDEHGEEPPASQQSPLDTLEANSEPPPLSNTPHSLDEAKPTPGKGRKRASQKTRTKEPVVPLLLERPTRERKAIDRFSSSVVRAKTKEIKIAKGSGTRLQDIPNVVFKLSRRKGSDEPVQYLHKLIFGKRVKPHQVKMNILQFSGFVWGSNEEKEKAKIKEKLEKSMKETLLQVSDMLDLGINRTGTKKEELVQKLFEFLESPYKISKQLLQEEMSKEKKRKTTPSKGKLGTPYKRSKHETYSSRKRNKEVDEEDFDGVEGGDEEFEETMETKKIPKSHRKKPNVKQHQPKKPVKNQVEKELEEQPEEISERKYRVKSIKSKSTQKVAKRPSSVYEPKDEDLEDESGSKTVKSRPVKKGLNRKRARSIKSPSEQNKKAGIKLSANNRKVVDEDAKLPQEEKPFPSDEVLRVAICELLKDADFSKVTFTDVVKQLGAKLNIDLSGKKAHVKHLVQDEVSKIVDEEEAEDNNAKNDTADTGNDAKNGTADTGNDDKNGTADTGNDDKNDAADNGNDDKNDAADNGNDAKDGTADTENDAKDGTADTGNDAKNGTADTGNDAKEEEQQILDVATVV